MYEHSSSEGYDFLRMRITKGEGSLELVSEGSDLVNQGAPKNLASSVLTLMHIQINRTNDSPPNLVFSTGNINTVHRSLRAGLACGARWLVFSPVSIQILMAQKRP